jgi:ATP-binding cassette, subfamily C, bacterial
MVNRKRVRTPLLLQMETVECGAAALGIILGYFKCYVPLEELRMECGISREGSNILNIKKAAQKYGLQGRIYQRKAEEILTTTMPCMVLWRYEHFLVVEGFKKNKVFLNDPAQGPVIVSLEEFKTCYSGIVMTFEKIEHFQTRGTLPSTRPRLLSRMIHEKSLLLFLLLVSFSLMLTTALIPMLTKVFFDVILGAQIFAWGPWFFTVFLCIVILISAFALLQQWILIRLNGKLAVQQAAQYLWHILRLPFSFYQQRFSGEIAYRLSLTDEVIDDMTSKLAHVLLNCIFVFIYAFLLCVFNLWIGLIGLIATCINIFASLRTQKKFAEVFYFQKNVWGKFMGFAIGGVRQIETIKSMSRERSFFHRLSGYFSQYVNAEQRRVQVNTPLSALPAFLMLLTQAALFGIGGYLIIYEDFTLGLFMATQAMIISLMQPVASLIDLGKVAQNVQADINRLDEVLKNPLDRVFTSPISVNNQTSLPEGSVELRNVTFGYSPLAPPLIENLNLTILPGQRVALVGPTGCGKTTLVRLINGLLQPWSGEILIGGRSRSEISKNLISHLIATVDQEIFLFSGTIKDNLTLFDATVLEEQITKACQDAMIHDEIVQKPQGYYFTLSESGMNISGGQRQKLEIARGLLVNPKILILDEATNTLDSKIEEQVISNLRRRGYTSLMIAHRLSTLRDCDEILVLDQGKVIQQGRHESLKKEPGLYQELVRLETHLTQKSPI